MFKDGDVIVITKIFTEDEVVFFKDVFKSSEGDTEEPQKKEQDFVFKGSEVEEIGKDKVLEL